MVKDKGTIIVTGASRGIGAAITKELAAKGYAVAGLSRSGACADGAGYVCDMTDEAAIARTVAEIAKAGPIAALVNNAGQHITGPAAKLSAAEFEASIRINTTSQLVAAREVYPHLKSNGGGLVLNMGSFFGKLGVPHNVAYAASKAAVAAMTRCLAVEWARDNIRVLTISPGYIETDLNREFLAREKTRRVIEQRIPIGRPGTPQEVARLVCALIDADIPFLTGEEIHIDGGHGMNH